MKELTPSRMGKEYEKEIAKIIEKKFEGFGIECKRSPFSGGRGIKGDIMIRNARHRRTMLEDFIFELKCQQKVNVWKAYEQAKRDAGHKDPAVIFRKDYYLGEDFIMLKLEDFLNVLLAVEQHRRGDK